MKPKQNHPWHFSEIERINKKRCRKKEQMAFYAREKAMVAELKTKSLKDIIP